jgi:hypothetical protein
MAYIFALGGTMRIVRIIATSFCALALTSLMLVTGTRLYKMAAIRGWVSGATLREHVLTGKRIEQTERGPVYWIRWHEADPARRSAFQDNLDSEQWEQIHPGDKVTMAYYKSEPYPYKPDGIYTSPSNFAFVIGLLALEVLGGFCIVSAILKSRGVQPSRHRIESTGARAQDGVGG